jgi:hypothetical protein
VQSTHIERASGLKSLGILVIHETAEIDKPSAMDHDGAYRVRWKAITGESQAPLVARVCQKGVAPEDERVFQARPISPDTGLLRSPLDTQSQTAKIWLGTENPAIWTVSFPRVPEAWPVPYCILNAWLEFWKVNDCVKLNVGTEPQPISQFEWASQRSLDRR